MRIIAGQFRGRPLVPPPGDATRPITDRAKQSLFDVLAPLVEGSVIYDCFCGTGSMGLECLSRGAESAIFFDADRGALDGLRKNIAAFGVQPVAKVMAGDIFKLVRAITPPKPADLIFLDPPYRYLVEKPAPLMDLSQYLAVNHASSETTLIFRHDTKDVLSLPGWRQYDLRTYGSMTIELMRVVGE